MDEHGPYTVVLPTKNQSMVMFQSLVAWFTSWQSAWIILQSYFRSYGWNGTVKSPVMNVDQCLGCEQLIGMSSSNHQLVKVHTEALILVLNYWKIWNQKMFRFYETVRYWPTISEVFRSSIKFCMGFNPNPSISSMFPDFIWFRAIPKCRNAARMGGCV